MSKPNIAQKSPIILETKTGKYYWCACGDSKTQPFCDGSHKGTEFNPLAVEITEHRKVAWCACKHTGNISFCDGTHKTLL